MSVLAATVIFFVHFPSLVSGACDAAAIGAKMAPCMTSIATASGSTCDKWSTAVCCLKKEFSSCGADLSSHIDSTLSMMKSSMSGMPGMAEVSSCSMPSCGSEGSSGSSEPSPPVASEKSIQTMLEFASSFDPTTFDVNAYINAVKDKTGGAATAVVKAWDIILAYSVPNDTTDSQLTAAVAAAMNIAENLVTILAGGRRLSSLRMLAVDKQVSISAGDAATAKAYKENSAKSATTDSLTSTLGEAVTVKTQPVPKARIETKVTSTKSGAELETELKSPAIAMAVGGATISSVIDNSHALESSSGAFRSGMLVLTSIAVAVAMESL